MKKNPRPRLSLFRGWLTILIANCLIPVHAQDATKVQPGSYKVTLENEYVRVLEYNSRPGIGICGQGMHSHPAHLTVVLTPGKAGVKTPDGRTVETSNEAGFTFWSEAQTHEVENISGRNMRILLIELKKPALARPAATSAR
jgi:beta-alanine degradation protein BauB